MRDSGVYVRVLLYSYFYHYLRAVGSPNEFQANQEPRNPNSDKLKNELLRYAGALELFLASRVLAV